MRHRITGRHPERRGVPAWRVHHLGTVPLGPLHGPWLRLTLCAWLVLSAGLAAASPRQTIDDLVRQLRQEADRVSVEKMEDQGPAPRFSRPHPSVPRDAITPELAEAAAAELTRVSGDSTEAQYVRYHLIALITAATSSMPGETGKRDAKSSLAEAAFEAVSAAEEVPYVVNVNEPQYRREPREVWQEYERLHRLTALTIGVPPFTRLVYGQEALQHATPQEAARIRQAMARRDALRPQLSDPVRIPGAEQRNGRRRNIGEMVRRTRLDAARLAMQHGSGQDFQRLFEYAIEQAGREQAIGYDVLDLALRSIIEGRLDLTELDPAELRGVARRLDRLADAPDRWVRPKEGQTRLDDQRSDLRNLSDLAESLAFYFEFPALTATLVTDARLIKLHSERPGRDGSAVREELNLANIQAAIDDALPRVLDSQGRWNQTGMLALNLRPHAYHHRSGWNRNLFDRKPGVDAALSWAVTATGRPSQTPGLQARLQSSLLTDTDLVFNLSMRSILGSELPRAVFEPLLRRDVAALVDAMTSQGGWNGKVHNKDGWGDHAHAQYAVYALDAADRAGLTVSDKVWETIDRHWRATQQPTPDDEPAGWRLAGRPFASDDGLAGFDAEPSVLTTAGGVAALGIVNRVLNDGSDARQRAIDKGVAWLDDHFTLELQESEFFDWYFGMWSIQQVGRATGRAQFNDIDWFYDITPLVLKNQRQGLWYSQAFEGRNEHTTDPTMPTAMAMLYLASALDPVAIARVEHDFGWDDHPRALGTFTRYATQRYERDTHWTTTRLSRPLTELLNYPLMFIGATEALNFTDDQVAKLRDYCRAGGLLILNPSDPSAPVGRSFKRLFDAMEPDRAMATIEPDNTIYAIHREVRPSVRMQAIGSGIRPWAIWCLKDLGEDLANSRGESDALVTLSNLYLYRVGRNPRRTRLTSAYLPDAPASGRAINVARLRHDGDFDPEPVALEQLSRYLSANHQASLRVSTLDPTALSDSTSVAFLTTAGDGELTSSQAAAIRRWCESGGTLILDAAGGSGEAVTSAEAMLAAIFPDRTSVPISPRSPVLTGQGLPGNAVDRSSVEYRLFTLQQGVLTDRPRLSTVEVKGRDAVVFSAEDLTCGWAGIEHWGINGYTIDDARGLGSNAVLNAID